MPRTIALEEHVQFQALIKRIGRERIEAQGVPSGGTGRERELRDIGAERLAAMDAAGIDVQVLSCSPPGADLVDGEEGVALARDMNDALASAVREHPNRFAAFAHLPMREPKAAADELARAVNELGFRGAMVNGTTRDRFLDDPAFAPILTRAEELDLPIYLHPSMPPAAVHRTYYDGLPGKAGALLASAAFGWHAETAIHVLRLAMAGTFERHPQLKLIIGHMGEMLPVMLARVDDLARSDIGLGRSLADVILRHVHITTSGVFTQPPFMAALMTFGVERILFSVDYPYSENTKGRRFLDALVASPEDKAKIAHGNAERLLKLGC
ncbi:2-keto-4-carboxy-3-hexenedioate hydratase [Methylorubrum aminovorans]|uniref:2-keto-4-carboxy-3-hexenedioate hydratase n=1 Tax=Methylorubrum aminovorans TaxID=269069 RepID=A0ABQ4UAI6_9HYPH|nr:amidohydrolase family protein [Methylorubrum aminovorans]GJE64254.1 2-keto-4-carboxy-3-hexenedioate hydratase [Methylorubrum aminovorans]GMA76701.1 amidohydrolase [Methylorubrum aminovorans]